MLIMALCGSDSTCINCSDCTFSFLPLKDSDNKTQLTASQHYTNFVFVKIYEHLEYVNTILKLDEHSAIQDTTTGI